MAKIGAFARIGAGTHRKGTTVPVLFSLGIQNPLCVSLPLELCFSFILTHSTIPNLRTHPKYKKALPRKQPNLGPNYVQHAQELLNQMAQMRPFPPIIEINELFAKKGDYATALSYFDKLQLLGKRVDFFTVNIAINCYSRLNRVDFGFSLLGGLFKRGCMLTVTSNYLQHY